MNVISLKDVWLKYRIEFKENGKVIPEDFWALKEINIDVDKGETIGIIGENGAGKTTALKIIAGMLKPDRGTAQVNGTVSALMEISAGFQKDLTGRENIYIISSLFGLTKEQIDNRYNAIAEFASIGRFINSPVKNYSHGMYMRLAFAIAIHVDPDILLIDDIFVVGDIYAQRKCINKIFELKEKDKTILFALQDLEMLKRICSRGIFLREGVIIKDGPMDKVCSYYTETVGKKEGIVIGQNGPLGVVFNNGKLILRWKDETITYNLAGHSSMLISNREYLSTTADWQIQKSNTGREIIVIGKWPDISANQCWKITFLNEKEFLWEIMIQMCDEVFIEKFGTRVFFIDEYKSWFTLDSETGFPATFIHEMEGECAIVSDSVNSVIGFKGDSNTIKPVPTIVFDRLHDNTKAVCQVGNTGSEISGRLIQYQVFSTTSNINYIKGIYNRCFLSKVIIFGPEETEKVKAYLDHTKQIIKESTIIRKDSLSICCKDNKIEIYWEDRLLARGIGLNTKFRCQDKDYSALDGDWNIHKKNNEEIVITISWDELGFVQIWTLKLQTKDVILWEVEMSIDKKIKLRNKQVELVLSEEYERWIATEERGGFERLEKKGNAVILNKYINDCIGVESVYKTDSVVLPAILFKYEDATPRVSYISRIKEEVWATKLRYLEIDSKENFYTLPGRCEYFNGKIKVIAKHEEDSLKDKSDKKSPIISRNTDLSNELKLDRLSVVFNYGKGKIFWRGIEFTKGLGMYSSVFFRGVWYDSSQAFWEVIKSDGDRLIATGYWPWIPLVQIWEIGLLNKKTIVWKITKVIWEEVLLEREQVNIMFSDKYEKWFVYKQIHGRFPKIFNEHNGIFWNRLWCGDKVLSIGIKKGKIKKGIFGRQILPSVVFSCAGDCQAHYSVIENTDNLFQARILQYELDQNQVNTSDKNKYFEGQIKIAI